MLRHPLDCKFAFLAIICTLGIFLFPVANGPYASVHGPASALRAMRAWVLLLAILSLTFAKAAGLGLTQSWTDRSASLALLDLAPHARSSVLRC